MFYLILAIVSSAMVSVLMRLGSDKVKNNIGLLVMSYITSTIIAAVYISRDSFAAGPALFETMGMAVVNGFLFVGGFVLMQWNLPRHGVVQTSTHMRLGLIVCIVMSMLIFGEVPTALQVIGFVLAVGAIILNGGRQDSGGFRVHPGLILNLVVCGLVDTWMKVFSSFCDGSLSDLFLTFTFIVAALLCLCLMLYKHQGIGLWEIVFGAAVAVPNYYNARFLMKSLQTLPGIIVYPTFGVATLLLITVLGVCLFRERLSKMQWCSMCIILVALALLNM